MAILKKPYEISVWEDILVAESTNQETGEITPSHYQENRIMVIGSDEMTSPNKAFSPVLIKNMNGEVTFTFSMAYKYFDPASNAEVINPFIGYLINERKIKLHYDNKWYDLIIVDHQEDSETMVWQYTAKDAFVNELSKNGYAIEFSTELGNNQGTAIQLAKETVKNTDWIVDEEHSDILVQKVHEPMLRAEVITAFSADRVGKLEEEEERTVTLEANEEIYIFYSYIANKEVKNVQFLRKDDEDTFTFDDNNNIIGRNYRITSDISYTIVDEKITSFDVPRGGACQILYEDGHAQYTVNQGYRIVYGPLTTYDPVMERTVERYQAQMLDGAIQEVYKYTDSDYTTSNVVTSYITNGSNFNIYENGSIQGWSNATPTTKRDEDDAEKFQYQHLSLTTYPEIDTGVQLIQLNELTRIQGFLELKFDGVLDNFFNHTYFNSGFEDNASLIDHISGEQEFVFRIACAKATEKHGELTQLIENPTDPGVRAMVAYYKQSDTSESIYKQSNYRYIDKKEDIILNFTGEWTLDNPTITGGTFSTTTTTDEQTGEETTVVDYKNYIISNVVQEPTTNSVYKVDGDTTEYVWDSKAAQYVPKTSTNFINYYRTIARASKAVTNIVMTDPTVNIGIFLYTTDSALSEDNVYTYISDIQITKCVYDKNDQPITIGNIPTTTITEMPTYYLKPKEGATKEKTDVYYTPKGIINAIGAASIEPIYNTDSEKILSISEAQSNCFNILQTICETFECWLDLEVEHDDYGAVIPGEKRILLKEFAGKDNFAGFKYGINIKSIQRTLNSEEIVTKLIVDNVQSDYVDEGVMSIRNASANPSGEANIVNFDYYINKGLIKNGEDCRIDLANYQAEMKEYNNELNTLQAQKAKLEIALEKLRADRNVYTELIDTAKDKYNEGLADFKEATGIDYNEYVEKYGSINSIAAAAPIAIDEDVEPGESLINTNDPTPASSTINDYTGYGYGFGVYEEKNYRAYAYYQSYSGERDTTDGMHTALSVWDNGIWKSVANYKRADSTEIAFPTTSEYYNAWLTAWNNRALNDHGASTLIQPDTSVVVTKAYGYGCWSKASFVAIDTIYKDGNESHDTYKLYEWDEEEEQWVERYTSGTSTEAGTQPSSEHTFYWPWRTAWSNRTESDHGASKLQNGELSKHEAIIDIVAQLYTASATINNYVGILTNLNQEYDNLKLQVYGAVDYNISLSSINVVEENEQTYRYSRLIISDYIDGNDKFAFYFHRTGGEEDDRVEYESTVSTKSFEVYRPVNEWYDLVTVTAIPKNYQLFKTGVEEAIALNTPIEIVAQGVATYQLLPNSNWKEQHTGLQESIDAIQAQKDACEKAFYTKYSHYIKEGTWSSNDYVDAELYYLDALQTSVNSSMPKVEYSIDVAEISELEGLENYIFDVGDKTYIEDTEFFGWNTYYVNKASREITYIAPAPSEFENYEAYIRPAREEIIVSQVEWHLDEPETNVITVQNYKTRFEDLFQRLSATVQTVQYNEATYAKMTSLLDANGTINQNVLLASLNGISGNTYALTTDGSIKITSDEILVKNLTNSSNLVKINSEGIRVSSDGGMNWNTAVDGNGINAGLVTSGELNTQKITIGNSEHPTFRWDTYGLNAYRQIAPDQPYDLTTYVRFDQYGLYGIQNDADYKAESLIDVKDKAQFGLTWDGFFIKNSYTGGGLVQITSDNDFQVINADQTEKIKIGALEWTNGDTVTTTPVPGVAPSLYGIRINNDDGETVFKTGDDGNITITGTINATGGNFSDLVTVGKNTENSPYIAIDGTDASIKSSNYSEGVGYGWMINKDGDAVFNNITARGAIKTAVFEYAEIQAVGGIFIFRPSSTIRDAIRVGETDDIQITVEKPFLFTVGDWCKISNYTNEMGEPEATAILSNNGLTHVYRIKSINETNSRILILENAYAALTSGQTKVIDSITDIIGGALVDMGNKVNGDGIPGTNNYGIGINSSDNTVNLPARAISLFETVVDETKNPKVSYRYRGILGTLPQMSSDVDATIYNNMAGTQGIYTDNMYIGDNNQFVAFYEDPNTHKKELRIKAKQLVFEVTDEETGETRWDDVADIEAEGVPGPAGQDAVRVEIDSTGGNFFRMGNVTTNLIAHVYKGTTDITSQVQSFDWYRRLPNGDRDTTWVSPSTSNLLSLTPSDVDEKAVFVCEVIF